MRSEGIAAGGWAGCRDGGCEVHSEDSPEFHFRAQPAGNGPLPSALGLGPGRAYHGAMNIDLTGLLVFCLLVGAPAVVMMWMSPRWRIGCFVLGLVLAFGTNFLVRSPHDPMALMIFAGAGIALAALLVEIPAFAIRTVHKRRAAERGEAVSEERPLRFWPKRR